MAKDHHGILGLLVSLKLFGDDQGDLGDLSDMMTFGHDEGEDSGGGKHPSFSAQVAVGGLPYSRE